MISWTLLIFIFIVGFAAGLLFALVINCELARAHREWPESEHDLDELGKLKDKA